MLFDPIEAVDSDKTKPRSLVVHTRLIKKGENRSDNLTLTVVTPEEGASNRLEGSDNLNLTTAVSAHALTLTLTLEGGEETEPGDSTTD